MSNLSQFKILAPSLYDTVGIGEVIAVLTRTNPSTTYYNGDYLLVGNIYLISSYPLLYARLGDITAPGISYNPLTHFYIPVISKNYPSVTGSSTSTQPQITFYMRAR